MSVRFKDYYQTLGVPRDADADAIKRAFRRLAREHHPDVARDKAGAESRFKEINEAYEVLGDPERRRQYDALRADDYVGTNPSSASNSKGRQTRPGQGFDGSDPFEFQFDGTGFSDFFEQFFGRDPHSGTPAGDGIDPSLDADSDSEDPGPSGPRNRRSSRRSSPRPTDRHPHILVTFEEALRGFVRSIVIRRTNPRIGAVDTHTVQVRLPAGIRDGQLIRLAGQGQAHPRTGVPADLYLRVRLAAHPDFRRRGADLYHDLELLPWDAVLGAEVSIPTLDGPTTIRIPPGSGSGRKLRLRGRGLPGRRPGTRGDLLVLISIRLPAELTPRERDLWQELANMANTAKQKSPN
jgi:curved DNA-binding protein